MKILSIDIETYGCIAGQPQRYFHPRKSEVWDRVPVADMIQTVSLAWKEDDEIRGAVLRWADPHDRQYFLEVLGRANREGWWLIGSNMQFDVQYLRHCDARIRELLAPYRVRLIDVLILNFLAYDQRPEHGLKNLCHLLGVTQYKDHRMDYTSDRDPELWLYNQHDTVATLKLFDALVLEIKDIYGEETDKLSAFAFQWFSDVLWTQIHMSEVGVQFDVPALQRLHDRCETRCARLNESAMRSYHAPFANDKSRKWVGSQKTTDAFFAHVIDVLGLRDHPELKRSKETGKISTDINNLNLFSERAASLLADSTTQLQDVWDDAWDAKTLWRTRRRLFRICRRLRLLKRFRGLQKIRSTYTGPMLYGKERDWGLDCSSRLIDGRVYMQWYPCPLGQKDDQGADGGVGHGARWAAKHPAGQTFPKIIKACLAPRCSAGRLLEADLSQMELRIPALLSGDLAMLTEFQDPDCDLHARMIVRFMGEAIREHPDFAKYRQAGKTLNFATLFGASAHKLQDTLRKGVGLSWSLEECQKALDWFRHTFARLKQWQQEQIGEACRRKYLDLPLTGQSRTFAGTDEVIRATYTPHILNLRVQGTAALILQSAQIGITRTIYERRLKSVVPLNCHDAIQVDVAPGELSIIKELVDKHFTSSLYYKRLTQQLGRSMLLLYSLEILKEVG